MELFFYTSSTCGGHWLTLATPVIPEKFLLDIEQRKARKSALTNNVAVWCTCVLMLELRPLGFEVVGFVDSLLAHEGRLRLGNVIISSAAAMARREEK